MCAAAVAVARCDTVRRRRQCRHLSSFIGAKTTLASTSSVGGLFKVCIFFFQLFFKNSIFLCNAFQFSTGANSVAKIRAMNGYEIISFLAAFMFVCLNEIKRDNDTLIGYTLQKKREKI